MRRGLGDPDHLEREELLHRGLLSVECPARAGSVAEVAAPREDHRQVVSVGDLDPPTDTTWRWSSRGAATGRARPARGRDIQPRGGRDGTAPRARDGAGHRGRGLASARFMGRARPDGGRPGGAAAMRRTMDEDRAWPGRSSSARASATRPRCSTSASRSGRRRPRASRSTSRSTRWRAPTSSPTAGRRDHGPSPRPNGRPVRTRHPAPTRRHVDIAENVHRIRRGARPEGGRHHRGDPESGRDTTRWTGHGSSSVFPTANCPAVVRAVARHGHRRHPEGASAGGEIQARFPFPQRRRAAPGGWATTTTRAGSMRTEDLAGEPRVQRRNRARGDLLQGVRLPRSWPTSPRRSRC